MAGVGSITYSENPPTEFLVYLDVLLQIRKSLLGISNSKTPPLAGISLFKMLVSINFLKISYDTRKLPRSYPPGITVKN
jgi:hypothetical protein